MNRIPDTKASASLPWFPRIVELCRSTYRTIPELPSISSYIEQTRHKQTRNRLLVSLKVLDSVKVVVLLSNRLQLNRHQRNTIHQQSDIRPLRTLPLPNRKLINSSKTIITGRIHIQQLDCPRLTGTILCLQLEVLALRQNTGEPPVRLQKTALTHITLQRRHKPLNITAVNLRIQLDNLLPENTPIHNLIAIPVILNIQNLRTPPILITIHLPTNITKPPQEFSLKTRLTKRLKTLVTHTSTTSSNTSTPSPVRTSPANKSCIKLFFKV